MCKQYYVYDLLELQMPLDEYGGKEMKLYAKNPYTERKERVSAMLLSNSGQPIFKIGGGITFGNPDRIIFPDVPENVIVKPRPVRLLETAWHRHRR
jgi:hypothetical protein